MGPVSHSPVQPAAERDAPEGWPERIVSRAWVGDEDEHYFALNEMFNVAAIGDSPQAALHSLGEMVEDYLMVCWEQGLPFEQVVRRVPLRRRVRLEARRHVRGLRHRPQRRVVEAHRPAGHLVAGGC